MYKTFNPNSDIPLAEHSILCEALIDLKTRAPNYYLIIDTDMDDSIVVYYDHREGKFIVRE